MGTSMSQLLHDEKLNADTVAFLGGILGDESLHEGAGDALRSAVTHSITPKFFRCADCMSGVTGEAHLCVPAPEAAKWLKGTLAVAPAHPQSAVSQQGFSWIHHLGECHMIRDVVRSEPHASVAKGFVSEWHGNLRDRIPPFHQQRQDLNGVYSFLLCFMPEIPRAMQKPHKLSKRR
jgi:hypothetical protein